MIQKEIFIRHEHYDYFGGQKRCTEGFLTWIDAWNYYKHSIQYDYSYDDGSYTRTYEPCVVWRFKVEKTNVHKVTTKKYPTPILAEEDYDETFFMDYFPCENDYDLTL